MADATPALERMVASLEALRLRTSSPTRQQRIDLVSLRAANRFGTDSTPTKIARVDDASNAIDALFTIGSFESVMNEAELAIIAL